MSERTKLARQAEIQRLLMSRHIDSQVELASLLRGRKVIVGQATVSRDLAELGASLVRDESGAMRYTLPSRESTSISPNVDLGRSLAEHVIDVHRSGDLIIVMTPPARASIVAFAIDRARIDDILGTIAGDDTVLVVAGKERGAAVQTRLGGARS